MSLADLICQDLVFKISMQKNNHFNVNVLQ